jgi:hypothetical protein
MTENQKDQTVPGTPVGNQNKGNDNSQNPQAKKEVPTDKNTATEQEKVKPMSPEIEKEREEEGHKHETSNPVSTDKTAKGTI